MSDSALKSLVISTVAHIVQRLPVINQIENSYIYKYVIFIANVEMLGLFHIISLNRMKYIKFKEVYL